MLSSMSRRKWIGLLLVFFICAFSLSTPFQTFASMPSEFRFFTGQDKEVNFSLPVSAQVFVQHPEIVEVNGRSEHSFRLDLQDPLSFRSASAGDTEVTVKLFGKIPLKTFRVHVEPELKVIPGGQTIGVKMKSDGVLVVGYHKLTVKETQRVSPGEEAGIRAGDRIISINGKKLKDIAMVSQLTAEAGKAGEELVLEIERGKQRSTVKLKPIFDEVEKMYRLGLYIRDSAAGVGTLTFYAPEQEVYGALGHVITDMDTQTPIVVGSGEIVHTNVTSISKSQSGEPGEKRANFFENGKVLGNIQRNTEFGIFGTMKQNPEFGKFKEAIPVAFAEEVKEGPAKILTVLDGQKVEEFEIEIMHAAKQNTPQTKGLVIKVKDQRLLEATGGIVQGMSGSPIIQNGKLVGAVTHVFVNDPTSGYGCFIEWMLKDAGIHLQRHTQQRAG